MTKILSTLIIYFVLVTTASAGAVTHPATLSSGILYENAVSNQQQLSMMTQAATNQGVMQIYSIPVLSNVNSDPNHGSKYLVAFPINETLTIDPKSISDVIISPVDGDCSQLHEDRGQKILLNRPIELKAHGIVLMNGPSKGPCVVEILTWH